MAKLIYIAGPYTAETEEGIKQNIQKAEAMAKDVFAKGFIPIVPHSIGYNLNKDERFINLSHSEWMERLCFPLLKSCYGILFLEGWEKSRGSIREKTIAEILSIPIFHNIQELPYYISEVKCP